MQCHTEMIKGDGVTPKDNNIDNTIPRAKKSATISGNFEMEFITTMNVVIITAIVATIHAIKNDKEITTNFIIGPFILNLVSKV